MKASIKQIGFCAFILMAGFISSAQQSGPPFKVTADLVSSYIWRGSQGTANPVPSIQPTLAYLKGGIEAGVWGSIDFTGSYKELDPYVFFTISHIKLGVTDYNWNFNQADYFNYKNSETGHRIEATFGLTGTEKLPLSATWNTVFYGNDKKPDDSTKQAFSTYIEISYTKGIVILFFGFTPWESYYNNYGFTSFDAEATKKSFSIVNVGVAVSKAVKITESYSLPIKASLIVNPSATYSRNDFIHLVFGITF